MKVAKPWARYDRQFFNDPRVLEMPDRHRAAAFGLLLAIHGYAHIPGRVGFLTLPEVRSLMAALGVKSVVLESLRKSGAITQSGGGVEVTTDLVKRGALHVNRSLSRRVRQEVFDRAHGLCGLCARPLTWEDMDVDHIIPFARGGEHHISNLQAAHRSCNRRKGARA